MRYLFVISLALLCMIILSAHTWNAADKQQSNQTWTAPKSADELKNPFKNKKDAALDGKKIFIQNCVSCHGDEGIGNGVAAANLNPKPSNLTSKPVQQQSDGAIFWKISNGRGLMVAWQYTLSENQRWQLVDYLRVLGKKSK